MDNRKMIFGFMLLAILTILALCIALGKVEEQSSYGLQIILGAIATLSGSFATWAFSSKSQDKP